MLFEAAAPTADIQTHRQTHITTRRNIDNT